MSKNYWVFILKDGGIVFEKICRSGTFGFWGSRCNRVNLELLKQGDLAIFYWAGAGCMFFSGEAKISSALYKPTRESYNFPERGPLFGMVNIKIVDIWENKKLYLTPENRDELGFIKDKFNWGLTFRKSIVLISDKDYRYVKNNLK